MPDGVGSSALLRRQIGRLFTELRTRADLTEVEAAKLLDTSATTLRRIEAGEEGVRFKEPLVRAWVALYPATAEEADLLVAMTNETRSNGRGWWHSYANSALPKGFTLFIRLEDSAATITEYEPELVPGLLQTRAYAEQTFRPTRDDENDIKRLTEIRMKRQTLLTRDNAPRFDVILNEAVLRRPVGGPGVMTEQLGHVLDVAERDNVSVRVLPFSVGMYTAMGTAFTVLTFPTDGGGKPLEPPLVYADTYTGSMGMNEPDEIALYQGAWADISAKALDVPASREMITEAMKGFADA